MKVAVSYGEKKKLVEIPNDHISFEQFYQLVDLVRTKPVVIKYYNASFDDNFNVENDEELTDMMEEFSKSEPKNCKISITVVTPYQTPSDTPIAPEWGIMNKTEPLEAKFFVHTSKGIFVFNFERDKTFQEVKAAVKKELSEMHIYDGEIEDMLISSQENKLLSHSGRLSDFPDIEFHIVVKPFSLWWSKLSEPKEEEEPITDSEKEHNNDIPVFGQVKGYNKARVNPFMPSHIEQPSYYKPQDFTKTFQPQEYVAPSQQLAGSRNLGQRARNTYHILDLETGETVEGYGNHGPVAAAKAVKQSQEARLKDRNDKSLIKHMINEEKRAQEFIQEKEKFLQQEQEKVFNSKMEAPVSAMKNAAIQGGISGGVCGLASSAVSNVYSVYKGEKSTKEAALDVVMNTGISAGIGAGTSAGLTAIQVYGSGSGNQMVTSLSCRLVSNANVVIPVLFLSWNVFCEVKKFYKKEIDGKALFQNLTILLGTTAAGIGTTVGAMSAISFFVPGAGMLLSFGILTVASAVGAVASLITKHQLEAQTQQLIDRLNLKEALNFFHLSDDEKHLVNKRYKQLAKIHHPDLGGTRFLEFQMYYGIIMASMEHKKPTSEDFEKFRQD